MTTRTKTNLNGVDVNQLMDTINAIQENPDLARFQFRARNEWVNGGHSRTIIDGFYGAGEEDSSRTEPFVLDGDEPPVLLGNNNAPNAVEAVLHALASCLAVGFIYEDVRPGYEQINLTYRVESDAPRKRLEALCDYVQQTSPVLDIITNKLPVSISLE